MSWENEFAKAFKERDNVMPMGVLEGIVISTNPLRVKIKEGLIILEPEQIYVSRGLTTKHYKAKGTGKLKGSNLGTIKLNGTMQITDELKWSDVDVEFDFELTYQLEEGQKVYVIPTTSEQMYFICDVIENKE
jgi:hypothetical protein|uniref:Uncharacterized protein n=1 Tax=Siphoviridae sp. ctMS01 TaxID=2823574 RepID=A0A8S5LCR5_9CAUD|nr:MAG TPA: Protein of unknown function DUF2577 [Siphoviridae sp. ctMS01]DAS40377.1 MAG TPA: Protein of unknown function (DUF2577) [Caudoviricetes sp.]